LHTTEKDNRVLALAAHTGCGSGLDWSLIGLFTDAAALGAWDGKRLAAKVSGHRPVEGLRRRASGGGRVRTYRRIA
jgi:hypothetical protein